MEGGAKSGEKLGGTLGGSGGGKSSAKEKGSGIVFALCSDGAAAERCIAAKHELTVTP